MNHTNKTDINKEVNITAWSFRNRQRLVSFPKRMEFDHQEYTFADGLRYIVQKGRSIIQLFDMTDGTNQYRLRFDSADQCWTLVSIQTSRAV